jgi:large subunit ribosomal protein L24
MKKIIKGDEVIVITGKDKGKRGTVQARVDEDYVLVDGINVAKKHVRPNPMQNQVGGIVDKTMPIHQSNLMIFNPATGKGDRVAVKKLDGGKNVRVFKSNGEQVKA